MYESVRRLNSFEPFLSKVENLEALELEDCVRGIPEEWCGEHPEMLNGLPNACTSGDGKCGRPLIDAKNSSLSPFPNWE